MKFSSVIIYVVCGALANLFVTCKNLPNKEILFAFQEKFPNAKNVIWQNEEDDGWEVDFNILGVAYSADFDAKGVWLETEKQINLQEVPAIVLKSITSKYAQNDILNIYEEKDKDGVILYEFDLKIHSKELEIEIDLFGKYLTDNEDNND